MIDVFYLTVKSTSPTRKIRGLGSVQEPENVKRNYGRELLCFWHENHHLRLRIFRFSLKVFIVWVKFIFTMRHNIEITCATKGWRKVDRDITTQLENNTSNLLLLYSPFLCKIKIP